MAKAKGKSSASVKFSTAPNRRGAPARTSRQAFLALPPTDVPLTRVRTLSGQAATQVGRPGYRPLLARVDNTKLPIRRLIMRDPANGMELPAADRWTNQHIDLGGPTITIHNIAHVAQPNAGSRVVKPLRQSAPIRFGPTGKTRVVRPNNGLVAAGRLAK